MTKPLTEVIDESRAKMSDAQKIERLREALDELTLVIGLTAIKYRGQLEVLQKSVDRARQALKDTQP